MEPVGSCMDHGQTWLSLGLWLSVANEMHIISHFSFASMVLTMCCEGCFVLITHFRTSFVTDSQLKPLQTVPVHGHTDSRILRPSSNIAQILQGNARVSKKRGKNSSLLCQQRLNLSVWSNEWYHQIVVIVPIPYSKTYLKLSVVPFNAEYWPETGSLFKLGTV